MDIDTSQGFLHVKQEVIYIQAFFRPVNATVFVKYQHYVNAQNRVKMLELKDSDSSKVKGQIHALENQIVKMEQQNERFTYRGFFSACACSVIGPEVSTCEPSNCTEHGMMCFLSLELEGYHQQNTTL